MSNRRKPPSRNPGRATQRIVAPPVDVRDKFNAELPDAVPGEHLWTFMGIWPAENPAGAEFRLDPADLLTLTGPTCLNCEQSYPEAGDQPCPGVPAPPVAESRK